MERQCLQRATWCLQPSGTGRWPAGPAPARYWQPRPLRGSITRAEGFTESGVSDLLARDRRKIEVVPELAEGAAAPASPSVAGDTAAEVAAPDMSRSGRQRRKERSARRQQRRREAQGQAAVDFVSAQAVDSPAEDSGPKRSKEALDAGLAAFSAGNYQEAIELFSLSLELPGNGAYRLATSPREYSCPSELEENAALYNLACAYTQLGQNASALTCLEAALENGFSDFATIRSDPDLQKLQGSELEALINRFDGIQAKLQDLLGFGKKPKEQKSDTNKPWILW